MGHPFLDEDPGGADDLLLIALGKYDALGITLGLVVDAVHHAASAAEETFQPAAIGVVVRDRLLRHACLGGSTRHRHRHVEQHAVIERLGDEVLAAEGESLAAIGAQNGVGHFLFRQLRQGVRGGQLHLVIDGGGAAIERAAEDEGEAEDVVDLVRVIGAARGHDDVGPRRAGFVISDLRIGIGHGEDDGVIGHRPDHVLRNDAADGEADQDVGALHGLGKRPLRRVHGEFFFVGRHIDVAAFVDDALAVGESHVSLAQPHLDVEPKAGHGRGARAGEDELHVLDIFPGHFQRVAQRRGGDDGGSMLVVVEDRDLHLFLQPCFDLEALRRGDVFEVDTAERRLHDLYGGDECLGVARIELEIEHVDVGEALEEDGLPFHGGRPSLP